MGDVPSAPRETTAAHFATAFAEAVVLEATVLETEPRSPSA
jgi:hypothetical protein